MDSDPTLAELLRNPGASAIHVREPVLGWDRVPVTLTALETT